MKVQEVKWAEDGTEPAQDYKILFENDNKNCWEVTGLKICKGIISLKTICFSDKRSSDSKRLLV
jgi:hypothetical protein